MNTIDNKLDDALAILKDTENVGINILTELNSQREKITTMKNKTTDMNRDITKSNVILTDMKKRENICILM
jgi:hypothetical protein